MKFTRDVWLALGLIFTLVVIMTFVALGQQQGEQQLPALTSTSNAPDGALALKLWLRQMDYPVLDELLSSFVLPEGAKIALILEPSFVQEEELDVLDDWVKSGGTLIAAGNVGMGRLSEHFDFKLDYWNTTPKAFALQ